MHEMNSEHWVFAYGSLMWNPGFEWELRLPARVFGYHRAFCIYSWHYRGTPEDPGLVLGLDRGGSCHGIAYRVASARWAEVVAYLDAREMVTAVYHPVTVTAHLNSRKVSARAYAVDRAHAQYAGTLPAAEQARIIRAGHGLGGPNMDYFKSTIAHLEDLGLEDRRLAKVARLLKR